MNKLFNRKYLSTALVSVVLTGQGFASNSNNDQSDMFASARAMAPDWAQESTNEFIDQFSGIMSMVTSMTNRPEGAELDLEQVQTRINSFQSNIDKIIADQVRAAQQQADKERGANPALAELHGKLMSAVEKGDMKLVVVTLSEMKAHAAPENDTAHTMSIEKATEKAQELRNFAMVECIYLNFDGLITNPTYSGGLSQGFLARASNKKDWDLVNFVLDSKIPFTNSSIDNILYNASGACNLPMIKRTMDIYENKGWKPSSFFLGMLCDRIKEHADKSLVQETIRYVIQNVDRQIGISSGNMSDYFDLVVALTLENGPAGHALLQELLSRDTNNPDVTCPSSYDIDMALSNLIFAEHSAAARLADESWDIFFNRTENQPRPSDYTISSLMSQAARLGCLNFIQRMVNRDASFVRPTEEQMVYAYREAVANGQAAVAEFLRPLIPNQDVQREVYVPAAQRRYEAGGLMAIHHYADAPVKVKGTEHASVKLLDAVQAHLMAKCKVLEENEEYVPMTFEVAQTELADWITTYFPAEEQQKAKEAAFFRLVTDKEYEEIMTLVVAYLKNYHPEGVERWLAGFIKESLTAYNGEHGASCDRGIRERVSVGLRGIDAELDNIFVQVEGRVLMTNTIKKWNPIGEPAEVARHLVDGGLSLEATADEAAQLFVKLFSEDVKANGLGLDEYQAAMDAIAEGISGNFEAIKAHLKN